MNRPIGIRRLRREGLMAIHQVGYRGVEDGQQVRLAPFGFGEDGPPSYNRRRFRHVDLVIPDLNGEHASGLILRLANTSDVDAISEALRQARELLEQPWPTYDETLDEQVAS